MKIYIKYMVSNRCKLAVKEVLNELNLHYVNVDLGEVEITENISAEQRESIKLSLLKLGLELMEDKRLLLIENIKMVIVEMVQHSEEMKKTKFSDYLCEKLEHNYTYLSNLFSTVQGTTIESYLISHKVERIKELINCGVQNLTEIAWIMNYSSVSHLSNQFKKMTGLTPSHFKNMQNHMRIPR